MAVINRIAEFEADMTAWRRPLHTIPELGFDLFDTAAFVAARLREIGVDYAQGDALAPAAPLHAGLDRALR